MRVWRHGVGCLRWAAVGVALYWAPALAAGSKRTAWLDASQLPASFASRPAFDEASLRECEALAVALDELTPTTDGERTWLEREKAAVTRSAGLASGEHLTWAQLRSRAQAREVSAPRRVFWTSWVGEQARLARLFPKPTSEVSRLSSGEVLGDELPDLTFALTFDDGPTKRGGSTDQTLDVLRAARVPATFFVQGERIALREDAKRLYSGFCVGSHGWRHVPHTVASEALRSVRMTSDELEALGAAARVELFRPPYGQRSPEVVNALEARQVRTILWNIDSQDWREQAVASEVVGRVLALMLVQRRGVILFHDVHPSAREVVPALVAALRGADVTWVGCEQW